MVTEQTKFFTADGKEFDNLQDAEHHEAGVEVREFLAELVTESAAGLIYSAMTRRGGWLIERLEVLKED